MKKYVYMMTMMFIVIGTATGQIKNEYGTKFEFDSKNEQDPNFVLIDNYGSYLLTVLDVYGIMAGHQMIVRKFDQKHNLVETFKYDFPKIDPNSSYEYLGFSESQNSKVATFVEVHSGKAKKSDIYKLEFDKSSGKFSSTLLATNPIISQGKAGNIDLEKSDNGKFIAINYKHHREKGLPEKTSIIMLDAATLSLNWQKDFTFEDEYTSQNFAVTNSGKVALVRDMNGSKKGITYISILSSEGQEDKRFDAPIFLNQIKSVSIGAQDYLIALNSKSKNFRTEFYNSLLLLDLKTGAILNNNKISEFAEVPNLENVHIRYVGIQNNEMHIFTEAQTSVKLTSGTVSAGAGFAPKYAYGPSFLYITSLDGKLKGNTKINIQDAIEDGLHRSYGLAIVKGRYYINTGNYDWTYSLNHNKNFEPSEERIEILGYGDPYAGSQSKFVNQLISYSPDKNGFLYGRILDGKEMSLVSVVGIK